MVLENGDYNGDGMQDLLLRPVDESGAVAVFSDGRGGFADEPLSLPGGPQQIYPRRLDDESDVGPAAARRSKVEQVRLQRL